mgnify:CR=1 FL=1
MVVDFQVIAQRRFELCPGGETGLVDDLANSAIEAFDHAIGLRMAWRDQAMLDYGRAHAICKRACNRPRQLAFDDDVLALTAIETHELTGCSGRKRKLP